MKDIIGHKNISSLKRVYNEARANKEEKGITKESIGEVNMVKISLYDVAQKYDMKQDTLDDIVLDHIDDLEDVMPDEDIEFDNAIKQAEEAIIEERENNNEEEDEDSSWKSIFKTVKKKKKRPTNEDGEYENDPSLTIIDRITYRLKLADPSEDPYKHNGTNKWNGQEYTSFLLKVKLLGISDETLYEDVFESGDNKGDPLYIKGTVYALWLNAERGMPEFIEIFENIGLKKPDGRVFYLKRFKKTSKKGRKYNVFKFAVD